MAHLASDGFFDVDDAEKVAAARHKWLEAEREMLAGLKASKRLGEVAAAGIKALYPRIEGDGFIDVDDAEKVAELRQKWLEAERQALAEFKLSKLGQEAFSGDAFKGQSLVAADHTDPLHAGRDMIVKRPVVDFQSPDEADENHLKHPGMGRSALQRLNLFVGHVLILLRLRKPAGVVDPAQAKPEKGAA